MCERFCIGFYWPNHGVLTCMTALLLTCSDLTNLYWHVWMGFYWPYLGVLTCMNAFISICSDLTSVHWHVWMCFYWPYQPILTCLNAFLTTCSDLSSAYWHVWTLFYGFVAMLPVCMCECYWHIRTTFCDFGGTSVVDYWWGWHSDVDWMLLTSGLVHILIHTGGIVIWTGVHSDSDWHIVIWTGAHFDPGWLTLWFRLMPGWEWNGGPVWLGEWDSGCMKASTEVRTGW